MRDTAIALRVLDLEAMCPGAAITANQRSNAGPDLVCWNCASIASGHKVKETWVWEFKAAGQSNAAAVQSLESGMADAANDPLNKNQVVKAGPAFPSPNVGVVPNAPNEIVTVYSDPTPQPEGEWRRALYGGRQRAAGASQRPSPTKGKRGP
ncbi:hypothetical protein ACGFNF_24255 [Micromonospora sp. NPDC048868]|uniref:hypothetical protein n=1 Tax=Micromonospora sp. NPDC048868 TaxID=3364258 RepID=UPI0037194344